MTASSEDKLFLSFGIASASVFVLLGVAIRDMFFVSLGLGLLVLSVFFVEMTEYGRVKREKEAELLSIPIEDGDA